MNHSLTKVQYLQTLIDKLLKSASLDKWRLCSESYWFLRIFVPSSYELRKKILSILCIPIFLFHFQTVNILGFKSLDICDKSTNNPHFMTLGEFCDSTCVGIYIIHIFKARSDLYIYFFHTLVKKVSLLRALQLSFLLTPFCRFTWDWCVDFNIDIPKLMEKRRHNYNLLVSYISSRVCRVNTFVRLRKHHLYYI